jgi:hypothetical protein
MNQFPSFVWFLQVLYCFLVSWIFKVIIGVVCQVTEQYRIVGYCSYNYFFIFSYFLISINIKIFPLFYVLYYINNFLFTTIQNFSTFLYIYFLFYISSSLFTNSKINNSLFCSVLYMSLSNKPIIFFQGDFSRYKLVNSFVLLMKKIVRIEIEKVN